MQGAADASHGRLNMVDLAQASLNGVGRRYEAECTNPARRDWRAFLDADAGAISTAAAGSGHTGAAGRHNASEKWRRRAPHIPRCCCRAMGGPQTSVRRPCRRCATAARFWRHLHMVHGPVKLQRPDASYLHVAATISAVKAVSRALEGTALNVQTHLRSTARPGRSPVHSSAASTERRARCVPRCRMLLASPCCVLQGRRTMQRDTASHKRSASAIRGRRSPSRHGAVFWRSQLRGGRCL